MRIAEKKKCVLKLDYYPFGPVVLSPSSRSFDTRFSQSRLPFWLISGLSFNMAGRDEATNQLKNFGEAKKVNTNAIYSSVLIT